MPPFFSIAETAPVVSFSQPSKTASSVHAELMVAYESNVFLMQLPSISANKLEHYRRTTVGLVHDKVVLSAGKLIFISNTNGLLVILTKNLEDLLHSHSYQYVATSPRTFTA